MLAKAIWAAIQKRAKSGHYTALLNFGPLGLPNSLAYETATIMTFRSRKDSGYQPLWQAAEYNVNCEVYKVQVEPQKQPKQM